MYVFSLPLPHTTAGLALVLTLPCSPSHACGRSLSLLSLSQDGLL
jgi:hypothetical protein